MKHLMILAILPLAGCATIFGDKSDQINIHSNDSRAAISVNGNEIGKGSATYAVPAGQTALITAHERGCADRSVPTGSTIRGAAFLDIFFWPTFLIDAATGAIHKTSPADYTVTPNCGNN